MTESSLGADHPFGVTTAGALDDLDVLGKTFSPVDTILDLDKFLSGDVRRAEKTARFYTRPELEADIEDLIAELDAITDSQGRPLVDADRAVGDDTQSAQSLALQIRDLQREYAASAVSVRFRQIDEDDWTAFLERHKKAIEEYNEGKPYPPEFYEDLIVRTAVAPKFTVEQVQKFRAAVGHPVFAQVSGTAMAVNTQSGVSIPKSLLSSAVLRQ